MKQKLASIDIGSYTARMLIARKETLSNKIIPTSRKREYISIADYFEEPGIIKKEAIERTVQVVNRFVLYAQREGVEQIIAVGTGVIRRAMNKDNFITQVKEATGIRIVLVSGKQEACLTAEGVIHSLRLKDKGSLFIVDIGGGSTEFFIKKDGKAFIYSIPIGAATLHNRYINSDPAKEDELYKVCSHVKGVLKEHLNGQNNFEIIIGTGGTVTALVALIYGMDMHGISLEKVNGKILKYGILKNLFEKIKRMNLEQKINILGLDNKRAKVIIPGIIILTNIMHLLPSEYITVSLSDILEGILIKPQILQEEI